MAAPPPSPNSPLGFWERLDTKVKVIGGIVVAVAGIVGLYTQFSGSNGGSGGTLVVGDTARLEDVMKKALDEAEGVADEPGAGVDGVVSKCLTWDWTQKGPPSGEWTWELSDGLKQRWCRALVTRGLDGDFSQADSDAIEAEVFIDYCSEMLIATHDHEEPALGEEILSMDRAELVEQAPFICAAGQSES